MTKYGIFIIESLRSEDFFDGDNLSDVLALSEIETEYHWIDSSEDLKLKLEEFEASQYRYLHLSCHADLKGIEINGEDISYDSFSGMIGQKLNGKRLFLAACKAGNIDFAARAIYKNHAMSVIGTPIDLYFKKSVLFWPVFYHVLHEIDEKKMNRESIKTTLQKCVDLLGVPINYYSWIKNDSHKMRRLRFRKNRSTQNDLIDIIYKPIKIDARKKSK